MRRLLLLTFAVALLAVLPLHAAVTSIMGGVLEGVPPVPSTGVLCESGCPNFFDIQPSNPSLMVGGPSCMFSEAGGVTGSWTPCLTDPPGGTALVVGIAVNDDGQFIAAQKDPGTDECKIYRSGDHGATWDLRYTSVPPITCGQAPDTQKINAARCIGNDCAVALYKPTNPNTGGNVHSEDAGTSWLEALAPAANPFAIYSLGGFGIWNNDDISKILLTSGSADRTGISLGGVTAMGLSATGIFPPGFCNSGTYKTTIAEFIESCVETFPSNTLIIYEPQSAVAVPSDPLIPVGLSLGAGETTVIEDRGGETYLFGKQSGVFGDCDTGEGIGVWRMTSYTSPTSVTWAEELCMKTTMPFSAIGGHAKSINGIIYVIITEGPTALGAPGAARMATF